MKTTNILIFNETNNNLNEIVGGVYTGVTDETIAALNDDLLYNIPLTVCGSTYQERKNDLVNKAIEYQNTWFDFCGFSYGELATIQSFFETNGRRYGLLTEFKENAIC